MKQQVNLSYSDIEEIRKLLAKGEKVYAIKVLKNASGLGLVECKQIIEQIERGETEFTIEKKSGGCYIATCVYGSYDCPEVWTLRRFRDNYLDKHTFGKIFIKTYYKISPKLVKLFGNSKVFKLFNKRILDKFVLKLKSKGYQDTFYDDNY